MLETIHWLGHASFRIDGSLRVYIDPWKLKRGAPADLILVTHPHFDHFSVEDIGRIATANTVILCPASCVQALAEASIPAQVKTVTPGSSEQVGQAHIEVVPAYNTNKPNHPKAAGHVGYIIEIDGQRIYHAGDTDLIPEMSTIRCDVALLPTGGKYTMNAQEAAQAAGQIRPRVVVPMHWGDIVGSARDVEPLRKNAPAGIEVVLLEPER